MALFLGTLCNCCVLLLFSTLPFSLCVLGIKLDVEFVVSMRHCSQHRLFLVKDSNLSRLTVVQSEEKPSHKQIINNDQARVDSLQHRRLSTAFNIAGRGGLRAVSVPAHTGDIVGTSNYIMNAGIGTPKQDFSVEFDTGSDLSWLQCKPCNHCYPQNDPLFDPAKSSTYSSIHCGSAECAQLDPARCSAGRTCRYEIQYDDKSRSSGNFSHDTLTLSPWDLLPNFRFGCGDHNRGSFGRVAGLIGLGRGESSLISQASQKYGEIFYYCLPSIASSTGYLLVGSTGSPPAGIRYTPMIREASDPSTYYVKLVAIKVGGKKLDINQKVFSTARTLMDSGR
ncbi:Aspartic proteinase nepenthesin-1 [Ananas comosus]|uniref:Aspartic proteinase nepenthesin-1 n=1 Tax=Ananas comosus TaxID=4615 RepID=A0A199UZW9_ANACO|nr:Aspartic proteinase nepenthesin-1 [Ananas comosus]